MIRKAYDGNCFNAVTESGVDLEASVFDLGDWRSASTFAETADTYTERARELFATGVVPFFMGGDHAVTLPIVAATKVLGRPLHVIQIDAHPDLYPELLGDPLSHACVARNILEMEHVASLTQFGIRTINDAQAAVANRHSETLSIYHARDLDGRLPQLEELGPEDAVYLTIDLDGLDPAYAPGVSHPVPGGLTARQLLTFIQMAPWDLVGMDVVELNPGRDEGQRTAVLAARLLHEGMGLAAACRAGLEER